MQPQTFNAAALDPYAERITTGVALLGGVLMLPALFSLLSGIRAGAVIVAVGVAAALAAFLLLSYAFQPTRYDLTADALIVRRRLARRLSVPYKEILGVSEAAAMADLPRVGLRRSFNAGVFGYAGPFQLAPYGRVFLVATNREKMVAVARVAGPPLLLSPARPKPFVEAAREALTR
ncbi:MAG: hypothetical protein H7Z42_03995 [Roseiflexaceae bacterium]|nr:hypothetical protein [Roseiflexaceae bacterium]